MTDNDSGDQPRPASDSDYIAPVSRGHRRALARQKAQLARERQKRRARGLRWGLTGGIGLASVAVIVAVVLLVVQSTQPSGPGPRNMADDGITIGKGFNAVQAAPSAPTSRPSSSSSPSATSRATTGGTVAIAVYSDYLCALCKSFEKTNDSYLRGLVKSGAATVDFHPVSLLTNQSLGTKYSQRAANAAACVANYSPNSFYEVNRALFARQPEQRTAGLTDDELISLIGDVPGVRQSSKIADCVHDKKFQPWVVSATQRALDGPLGDTSVEKLATVPLILVNGQQYKYTTPFSTEEFSNFVVTAAGNSFADNTTPKASAPPSPAPGATP